MIDNEALSPSRPRPPMRTNRYRSHLLPQPCRERRRIEPHGAANFETGNATVRRKLVDLAFADVQERRDIGHRQRSCALFE
jgi:hypothetical protein